MIVLALQIYIYIYPNIIAPFFLTRVPITYLSSPSVTSRISNGNFICKWVEPNPITSSNLQRFLQCERHMQDEHCSSATERCAIVIKMSFIQFWQFFCNSFNFMCDNWATCIVRSIYFYIENDSERVETLVTNIILFLLSNTYMIGHFLCTLLYLLYYIINFCAFQSAPSS